MCALQRWAKDADLRDGDGDGDGDGYSQDHMFDIKGDGA